MIMDMNTLHVSNICIIPSSSGLGEFEDSPPNTNTLFCAVVIVCRNLEVGAGPIF